MSDIDKILNEGVKPALEEKTTQDLIFPTKSISEVVYTQPEYLVESLLIKSTVGFISASPGSTKTWLTWDMALSVATGTPCLGVLKVKRGKVLAFNAEDSPGAITKPRLSALASKRSIDINDVKDLFLIDVPTLRIDTKKDQDRMKATIEAHKPSLVILDPLRQLHHQNEDKAGEMAPMLSFLRGIEREYDMTVLLVVHERKGSGNHEERREDRTRGSNVIEGWRDTAIYLDRMKDKKTKVRTYHRGYLAPEPFYFNLEVESENAGGENIMTGAELIYFSEKQVENEKEKVLISLIWDAIGRGADSGTKIAEMIGKRKGLVMATIGTMVEQGYLLRKGKVLVRLEYPKNIGNEQKNGVF